MHALIVRARGKVTPAASRTEVILDRVERLTAMRRACVAARENFNLEQPNYDPAEAEAHFCDCEACAFFQRVALIIEPLL